MRKIGWKKKNIWKFLLLKLGSGAVLYLCAFFLPTLHLLLWHQDWHVFFKDRSFILLSLPVEVYFFNLKVSALLTIWIAPVTNSGGNKREERGNDDMVRWWDGDMMRWWRYLIKFRIHPRPRGLITWTDSVEVWRHQSRRSRGGGTVSPQTLV